MLQSSQVRTLALNCDALKKPRPNSLATTMSMSPCHPTTVKSLCRSLSLSECRGSEVSLCAGSDKLG